MAERCNATTKAGAPCTFPAGPSGLCCSHDPARRAEQAERGRRGGTKSGGARKLKRLTACRLRSTEDLLVELEHALGFVQSSGAREAEKADATVKIVREARAVLQAAELERENAELRRLLLERHPELKKHLQVVS